LSHSVAIADKYTCFIILEKVIFCKKNHSFLKRRRGKGGGLESEKVEERGRKRTKMKEFHLTLLLKYIKKKYKK